MSDLQTELLQKQEENNSLKEEVRLLHAQVRKWSTYCAYVAGSSIGIILFLQFFASEEQAECEECAICEECPITDCNTINQSNHNSDFEIIENNQPAKRPQIKEVPTVQKQVKKEEPITQVVPQKQEKLKFPMTYTIKSGDNFSKIAERFYERASLASWLAKQNGIDPSKLQIGQKITLPKPPQ